MQLRQSLNDGRNETIDSFLNPEDGYEDNGMPDFGHPDDDMPEDMHMDEDVSFHNEKVRWQYLPSMYIISQQEM